MSQEELRRERQETYEELRRTQDVSGGSNFIWRGLSNATGWEVDYGGWYAPQYTGGDNGTDRDKGTPDTLEHTWEHDWRFFLRITSATKKTNFYARLKTTMTYNKANTPAVDANDWALPTFDMFYMDFVRTGRTFKHTWTFGRQYAQVERGIGFGMVADGLRYEMASRRNEMQIFFMRQQPGDDNVDATAAGWSTGRTKRWFYGLEWKWKLHPKFLNTGLSVLGNIDQNFEHADGGGQRHQLDSIYYGLGLSGNLTGRMSYWTQYIMESGKTYESGTSRKINLDADALDAGLRYFFPTALAPTLYLEYAAGSGDGDAAVGTSTTNGSTAGKDERFISFGGLSLGYAMAPQLINLKVWKFGGSVKPFGWSRSRLWQELVVQPTYYTYSKDKAGTAALPVPVPDVVATNPSKKLGSELDLTVAWRLAGDLKYQFKWGRFLPGAAYPTRSAESYVRLKLSLDL
ncbi:MAG: hypothetical protein A3G34_02710 [Candidatus Lindowbacteria bacterium RIFCSPLOWO2_12_FULL_62_27]|nr:MAG: hypothetical protein A3G34_02710 [Candidatus Lindowbacteria bacterium RIFCSPLOWO2_12_FULL_62_27]